eukprot:gnl/Spiro4/13211_TR7009_c0_g1_i1.p1 gnl/Spiro4/13211_TR7009_c0_g1~~gnl/Spiro4/13211_TR7009_c0_g1_i1.p1  ORF type:complete len:955 (-),score=251.69 gnl/Spiro4/13211_TR7009_c0_g1_i1:124-2940(-)
MQGIFHEAQTTTASHKRCVKKLVALHRQLDSETFLQQFLDCVSQALVVFKSEPAVDCVVQFVAACLTRVCSEKNGEGFFNEVINFLLTHCASSDKAVRFRVCQLLDTLLRVEAGEDLELEDDVFQALVKKLLVRAQDKVPAIRTSALRCLSRLQDPTDPKDPVTALFLVLISSDACKDVRAIVTESIGVSEHTAPALVARTFDICPTVRAAAYRRCCVLVDQTNTAPVLDLIGRGLLDRDTAVQGVVKTLLCELLETQFDHSVLDLLSCINVTQKEELACNILQAIFHHYRTQQQQPKKAPKTSRTSTGAQGTVAHQILSREELLQLDCDGSSSNNSNNNDNQANSVGAVAALYWRVAAAHLHEQVTAPSSRGCRAAADDERLDALLPTATECAELLSLTSDEFVVRQLLKLAHFINLQEEAGRRRFGACLVQLLRNTEKQCPVDMVMSLLRLLHTDDVSFMRLVMENLNTIQDLIDDGTAGMPEPADESETESEQPNAPRKRALSTDSAAHHTANTIAQFKQQRHSSCSQKNDDNKRASDRSASSSAGHDATENGNNSEDYHELVWLRWLSVAADFLRHTSLSHSQPEILGLREKMLPAVQHRSATVRAQGLTTLGLWCLLDKTEVQRHLELFLQVLDHDCESIQLPVLQILFDMFTLYGLELLPSGQFDMELWRERVLRFLESYLDHEESELRAVAAEGLAKLFINRRLMDPKTVAHLILVFFSPSTESDSFLRQCLTVFFQVYASSVQSQALIAAATEALVQIMRRLPESSVHRGVSLERMLQFIVHLLSPPARDVQSNAELGAAAESARACVADSLEVSLQVKQSGALDHQAVLKVLRALRPDSKAAKPPTRLTRPRRAAAAAAPPPSPPSSPGTVDEKENSAPAEDDEAFAANSSAKNIAAKNNNISAPEVTHTVLQKTRSGRPSRATAHRSR